MFSKRWLINYVLIVLIVLFTWIGNRYDVTTGERKAEPVPTLVPANIDSISIQTAEEQLSLRRADSGWRIEAPIDWPANNANLERVLDIARLDTDSRLPADEIDLNELGLVYPKAILSLNDTAIRFGITNNIGERRYILVDDTVYLLPDRHLPFIAQGLLGLVDRRLWPAEIDLERIELPDITLQRNAGQWQSESGDRYSDDQILRLADNWQKLEAKRVQHYDSTATPRQKIQLQRSDGSRSEFFVMSISPEIVIAHPQIGLQYHFGKDHYYELISLKADETAN